MTNDPYELSFDSTRLQADRIHAWLASTYWSPKIRRDVVERAIANSIAIGVYEVSTGNQVAFARIVTDRATFAWLCDVVVDEAHRGHGLGKRIVEATLAHPDCTTLRRFLLATKDAHSLYTRYGFTEVEPGRWLERRNAPQLWSEV